jgi:hypothetical protein
LGVAHSHGYKSRHHLLSDVCHPKESETIKYAIMWDRPVPDTVGDQIKGQIQGVRENFMEVWESE